MSAAVLRSWETRFGFPAPQRLESGHRRYTESDVALIHQVIELRHGGLRLEAAIATASGTTATLGGSVYATIRRHDPGVGSYRLHKSSLLAFSWAIEDECCALAQRPDLFGAFQTERLYLRCASRWNDLARVAGTTMVFADFEGTGEPGGPVRVPLAPQDPMRREWVVICDAPDLPAALAAWEVPGQSGVADEKRVFEAVWTFDPLAVRIAARTCAAVAQEHGIGEADALLDRLSGAPASAPAFNAQLVASLLGRVVIYTDRVFGSTTPEREVSIPAGR